MKRAETKSDAKTKFLDAARLILRSKGYAATTVDDICKEAGVSKGAFFHHFGSKEDLAVAAAEYYSEMNDRLYMESAYRAKPDPVERLLLYVEFQKAFLVGPLPQCSCLLGTLVQETYATHPRIREACDQGISARTAILKADISEALRTYGINTEWSAESLALYMQAVIQGAFILAKARQGPQVVADCLDHLSRYLKLLFMQPQLKGKNR